VIDQDWYLSSPATYLFVGLLLLVGAAALVIALVPLAGCPGCEFEGTPPYICVRCGDTLRVTLLKKWRCPERQKNIQADIRTWTHLRWTSVPVWK
jgi:hypothetical protein